ncbi:unnamed protein product [Miscanthus lutarioriparius]|uniref:Uncharacterized protein n=1 Tax=Miscanthus lutarioriparius TaxID=422564 RepID=A0A811S6G8_9POAL|nr:unnamed protein product [Miscanthus lutarioriparius]
MALVPIKQLDSPCGYLRWKESVLLRVHTLGVTRVLFEDRPTGDGDAGDDAVAQAAAKKWARDDAVCRGHILATLSDRLLPDYQRFATAADLWRALARTYHVDTPRVWRDKFDAFEFEEGAGGVFLEQIAHAEALGVAARLPEGFVAYELCGRLPEVVSDAVVMRSGPDNEMTMSLVWDVARRVVASGAGPERLWRTATVMADEAEGCCSDVPKPEQSTGRRNRGEPGHVAKNSRRRV